MCGYVPLSQKRMKFGVQDIKIYHSFSTISKAFAREFSNQKIIFFPCACCTG